MGDAPQVSYWDEAAATLEGARQAAWDEPPERYEERATECAEVVVTLLGDRQMPPTAFAVDLGCGPGRLLVAVRRLRDWPLMGVDSSRQMVHWAWREMTTTPGRPIAIYLADATSLPAAWAGRFDAAWSVAVLQHLDPERQQALVVEVCRLLRSGGRAVLQVVEGGGSAGPLAHDTSAADLRRWAEEAGMTVVAEARGLVQPGWLWVTLEKP